jgi:hypothetical protein
LNALAPTDLLDRVWHRALRVELDNLGPVFSDPLLEQLHPFFGRQMTSSAVVLWDWSSADLTGSERLSYAAQDFAA